MHDAEALCVPLQPLEVVHQAPRKVSLHLQQHTVHNEGCQRLWPQPVFPVVQAICTASCKHICTFYVDILRLAVAQQTASYFCCPVLATLADIHVCNVCTLRAIRSELSQLLSLLSTMRHLLHHDMCETPSHGMWWVTLTRTLTPSEIALHKLSR